jgi:hypothetical protein
MPENQSPVWPLPQEMTLRGYALPLGEAVVTLPGRAGKAEAALARLFADMVMDEHDVVVPVVRGKAPKGRPAIRISIAGKGGRAVPDDLPGAEGYLLRVTAAGAEAVGRDRRGAQYAIATMLQLTEKRGREVVMRGAEVRDWPYKPVRMVHLYLPGVDHLGYARRYMRDFLLRYKFNGILLEVGGGVRLPDRPEMAAGWRRFVEETRAMGDTIPIYGEHVPLGPGGRFQDSIHTHLADGRYLEASDLQLLCGWARDLDLEVIPEIQSLCHVYQLATVYREIAELPEAAYPDAYCPSNAKSYDILFDVMSTLIGLTGCTSVHIGHDEWRAGGLCPICRTKDTGELFGNDVVKVAAWLRERGQGVWMWADHLVPKHNGLGGSSKGGVVWYDHPQTMKAAEIIKEGAPGIKLLNWSHYLGEQDGDNTLTDLGFEWIFGNFHGKRFPDWPGRSNKANVLGAEVSSWCAWEDFELGMIHYPDAMYCINLLWSNRWPGKGEALELTARQLPVLRDLMRSGWEKPRLWSQAVPGDHMRVIPIEAAANAPRKAETWDLSGLPAGRQEYAGVPYQFGERAAVVTRRQQPAGEYPYEAQPVPIGGKHGSLIFWQAATEKGGHVMHAGDGTHYPREAAELLGWYEILYADGLTRTAEIRYGENVRAWDEGFGPLYYAREVPAGTRPDGEPLVVWGLEWTNPRPAVEIVSVTLRGAGATPETRPKRDGVSAARPMLLGITAVELPRFADYHPESGGKLPGME